MKVKIRKGDTVEIISGRLEDKGKRGEVINVFLENRRVVVQSVNIRTNIRNRCKHRLVVTLTLAASSLKHRLIFRT
jgi:ribosomal protein L24